MIGKMIKDDYIYYFKYSISNIQILYKLEAPYKKVQRDGSIASSLEEAIEPSPCILR